MRDPRSSSHVEERIERRRKDAAFASVSAGVVLPVIALWCAFSGFLPGSRSAARTVLLAFVALQLVAIGSGIFSFVGMRRHHARWIIVASAFGIAVGVPTTWIVFVYAGLAGAGP